MKSNLLKSIKFYNKIDSTNLEAKRLISSGKILNDTVLVTEIQTSGIGRLNREWVSEKGGLWFTMIFPNQNFNPSVTVFTGIVLHKILLHFLPDAPLMIKWPNDIFWKDKKMAGILCSNFRNSSIIGIGINMNQKNMPEGISKIATSVYIETGREIKLKKFLKKFLEKFEKELPKYLNKNLQPFYLYYKKYDYLSEKEVLLKLSKNKFIGKVSGISETGNLILNVNGREKNFLSADKIDIIR